ncbi:hypothetical protein M3Y94_00286300 [Aphelenchoides besseyi]|nr:hypothetical protein M3Y94_00286300 [Aphelenchoides besseyi]KAI6235943.1 Tudor domain-containing protein [Aphelenchoides besseyi]
MSRNELDLDDEIEEVRELLYDIAKNSTNGVDSVQLAAEYERQFVQTGIGRPLPAAWLRYIKVADEFEVRQENGRTVIGVVKRGSLEHIKPVVLPPTEIEPVVLAPAQPVDLKPLPLSAMPTTKTKVHILAATDPENISVRLCSWDPMPDYLYSALSRDFADETKVKLTVTPIEGMICIAKLPNGSWERVSLVRPSKMMGQKGYWVVYAVDVGVYHIAHQKNLQPLSSNVGAFDKVLLAKCQLAGVKPVDGSSTWCKNSQRVLNDLLHDAQGTVIEMIPTREWTLSEGPSVVPTVSAHLILNNEDLSQKLISQGFAEKIACA